VDLVAPGSRVLDLGCGDGDLLAALIREKQVRAEGIELSEECIQACVAQGLTNIHQGDLDEGLADHADQSVDYVLLTNTLQVLHRPRFLLQEMARVGRHGLITLPNFAHWSARLQLGLRGRMPRTARLPYEWYDTPNIHLTTLADFRDLLREAGLTIEREIPLATRREGRCQRVRFLPNLRADAAIFEVTGPPQR
jgi:methionine biosynthesis protein MetW